MKFPLNWLQEYIALNQPPDEIGKKLTLAGLEVDDIDNPASSEAVFEVSLTPNLGHCASILGVARELSAAFRIPLKQPPISFKESATESISKLVKVEIEDKKGCLRYAARLIRNVKIGPSPAWLQKRLQDCGQNSINNVVDITNYVVMELGQPLHAFDFEQLNGHKIVVRAAKNGERFTTLDGKERILNEGDVLICDANKPVALGGVMGGRNSEVTDQTTNILLEAAYFEPRIIRKTSKRHGLSTDASKRFERGTDPNLVLKALDRAAMLIEQEANGSVVQGIIDVQVQPFHEKQITVRLNRVNQILGTHLSMSEVDEILRRLHMSVRTESNQLIVTVPTYRSDISQEIDLIEEVARVYGFENIKRSSSCYRTSQLNHAPIFLFEREVSARLVAAGLQEVITCDLIGPTYIDIVGESVMPPEAYIKVLNPTSVEQSILRTSLLPGLLQVAKYNIDHQTHDLSGFEVGRIHFKSDDQYKEQSVAGIILMGKNRQAHWDRKPSDADFYDLKGIVENLLVELNIPGPTYKNRGYPTFHSGRQASIYVDALEIGTMGEVHPAILRRLDVTQRLLFAEINLQDLLKVRQKDTKMRPLAIYPSSERDWTITVDEQKPIEELLKAIYAIPSTLLEEVTVKDIYRSDKLGKGLKNATFHFVYRDNNKTVAQEDVDREHQRITSTIK